MSLKDVSDEQLDEVAGYLDKHSDGHGSGSEEEFWRLLIKELKRATPASGGKKIRYSMVEVEDFGTELLKDRSPGLKLLKDLQGKKLSLDVFVSCLEKIECVGAQNVFRTAAPPEITHHPASQAVRCGDQITLTCKAECEPPAQYLWFRGQTPIPGARTNAHIIRNATSGDSGWYVCRATNPNINDPRKMVFSRWAEVEVVGSTVVAQETHTPTITLHPAHASVSVGGSAVLECRAEGERLVYDWYKDEKLFRESQRHGKLIFDPVTADHFGEYHCVLVNDVGRVESSRARLNDVSPASPIVITEQPKDCRGRVGKGISLRCKAKGPPGKTLLYQWFQKQPGRDSKDKEIGTDFVCCAQLFFTPRLEYKIYCRVSLEEDPGVSEDSDMATVTVDSIWITRQPESIDCYIGDRASLICSAEGCQPDQKITYMWLRSVTQGDRKKHFRTCDSGVLPFDRLSQKDWGYYVCQAQNNYQHVQSEEVFVKVSAPPADGSRARDRTRPTIRFTKQPWSQVVPLGGRFRLLCEAHATADEPLHYQWYFNGTPLDRETDSKLIRERVLTDHIGSYYCKVQTNEGFAKIITTTARIEQAPPPGERNRRELEMSGEQLNQEEAERLLVTAKEERYAREKVALLIGNQRYQSPDMVKLNSSENDTRELAEKLRTLNFKVFSFVDLNFRDMMDVLEVFYGMLTLSGIYALFYYTGHGFSYGGVTYLMPVDATLPPKCDLNIAADDITAHMQNKKSRAVKILDCCRTSNRDDIESPTMSHTRSLGYSNIFEITSCPIDHFSYEDLQEPNSTFSVALRGALDEPRKITEVFQQILDNMRNAPQSLNGRPFQRPEFRGSLADPAITLHDHVMLDDPTAEEKLYEIGAKWEQAHVLPEPVLLPDELGGLLTVKLNFTADFSNVLVVGIIMIPAGSCTSAKVDVDTTFLESQGLRGEFYLQQDSPPDHPTHTIATLKVANLQRLEGKLKLCLKVSVVEAGRGEKEGTVVHELEQRPLFANYLSDDRST